jgi:hypothetical protein
VQILALLLGNCFNDVIAILGEWTPACLLTAPILLSNLDAFSLFNIEGAAPRVLMTNGAAIAGSIGFAPLTVFFPVRLLSCLVTTMSLRVMLGQQLIAALPANILEAEEGADPECCSMVSQGSLHLTVADALARVHADPDAHCPEENQDVLAFLVLVANAERLLLGSHHYIGHRLRCRHHS